MALAVEDPQSRRRDAIVTSRAGRTTERRRGIVPLWYYVPLHRTRA
ncbi:MAG: hypothetical protein FJ027_08485 [Candidatus Rokubacteria bacterium]|nr:hypothetical protein [Candidatus Rokubacteria bacterium]